MNESPNTTPNLNEIKFDANIAAVLSYLITPITGILFLYLEKKDQYVRFHAAQSVVFGLVLLLVPLLQWLLVFSIVGILLIPIISIAGFVMWVILMYKAYNHENYEIPYLAPIAKQLMTRF